MRAPSGEKQALLHRDLVAAQGEDLVPGRCPRAAPCCPRRRSGCGRRRAKSRRCITQSSWPRRARISCPVVAVPEPRRAVPGGGQDAGAVGRKSRRCAPNPRGRAGQGSLPGCRCPRAAPCGPRRRSGCGRRRGKAGAGYPSSWPRRARISGPVVAVPQPRRAVPGGGQDAGAVGRKAGAVHRVLVAVQSRDLLPVALSQSRAVRSSEAVRMRAPSGEKQALVPDLVAAQGEDLLPGCRCPRAAPCGPGRRSGCGAPSAEKRALVHQSSWPRRAGSPARCRCPRAAPCGPRRRSGCGRRREKSRRCSPNLVAAQGQDLLPRCRCPTAAPCGPRRRSGCGRRRAKSRRCAPNFRGRAGPGSRARLSLSQSRAVRSGGGQDAGAVGGKAGAVHPSSWPRRARISRPVSLSQSRAVRSPGGGQDAGAVGGKAGAVHPSSWPRRTRISLPGFAVPEPRRAVPGGGQDAGAVGGKAGAVHRTFVADKAEALGTGRRQIQAIAAPDRNQDLCRADATIAAIAGCKAFPSLP